MPLFKQQQQQQQQQHLNSYNITAKITTTPLLKQLQHHY